MSTRDIEAHLLEVYGVTASRELVSNITDVVTDEIEIWRNRPVDEVYPIVYIDGIRIKVRDKGAVTIKSAHLVIGVDVDGRKHALGCWIAETEGAKFWHSVLTQLRNRGLRDILIACCDGLTGLPDAITSVFPDNPARHMRPRPASGSRLLDQRLPNPRARGNGVPKLPMITRCHRPGNRTWRPSGRALAGALVAMRQWRFLLGPVSTPASTPCSSATSGTGCGSSRALSRPSASSVHR